MRADKHTDVEIYWHVDCHLHTPTMPK